MEHLYFFDIYSTLNGTTCGEGYAHPSMVLQQAAKNISQMRMTCIVVMESKSLLEKLNPFGGDTLKWMR